MLIAELLKALAKEGGKEGLKETFKQLATKAAKDTGKAAILSEANSNAVGDDANLSQILKIKDIAEGVKEQKSATDLMREEATKSGSESPKINSGFVQQLAHSLVGKDDPDEVLGLGGYAGQTIGDILRSRLGVSTTHQRGGASKDQVQMEALSKLIQGQQGITSGMNGGGNGYVQAADEFKNFQSNMTPASYSPLEGSMAGKLLGQTNASKLQQGNDAAIDKANRMIDVKKDEGTQLVWNKERDNREIKSAVMNPKMTSLMEQGGLAYKELRDVAKSKGIELNFEEGGWEAWKTKLVKKGFQFAELAPMMDAVEALRPELGTELMRQIGAFRSGDMAKRFEDTLPEFSGNIKKDIATMTTTMTKNEANVQFLNKDGSRMTEAETLGEMHRAEAMLIRKYNSMYRGMGLTTKPYLKGRDLKWVAENSSYSLDENKHIQDIIKENPAPKGVKEKDWNIRVKMKMIEQGVL